jgi:small-conductance mechanosensitive channel
VPDVTDQTNALVDWLSTNGIALAVVAIALLLGYRWARPAIHRMLVHVFRAQAAALADDRGRSAEVEKRAATVEDLLATALRTTVAFAIIAVVLGLFDLWPLLAGLGLVVAAITLAGQDIVLDYLMGILILVEGQYYRGDYIRVGSIEGTVEEVGLRRTQLRDVSGTVHSVSNGLIRTSSNQTSGFAIATIFIEGIADVDVERAIVVLNAVGQTVAADPTVADAFIEAPVYSGTTALSAYGATLRLSGRIQPDQRWAMQHELRRRVAAGLAAAGIEPIRPPAGAAAPPPPADQ